MFKMTWCVKCIVALLVSTSLNISHNEVSAVCTFPRDLQNGTWLSSDMGEVTFNNTKMSVEMMVEFGPLNFTCTTLTGSRYFLLSDDFSFLGFDFKIAMCFQLQKLTSTKYIYYLMSPVLDSTDVYRVTFQVSSYPFSEADTCQLTTTAPTQARLLVREGYANVSAVDCHNDISGRYVYSRTSSDCNETWVDMCTDKTEVNFNYTLCPDIVAYSEGGVFNCMWDMQEGDTWYTLLYNQDDTTNETNRYTCLVSKTIANTVYVSTYPRACLELQNSSSEIPPGESFTMIANNTCPTIKPTVTPAPQRAQTTTPRVLTAGSYIAIAIAIVVLIGAIAIVLIVYYIKVKRQKQVEPHTIMVEEKDKAKDVELDGRVSPYFPFPTVSELALYRFGPSEIDDDDGGMTLDATTPGFTDGRRTMYGKDAERESLASLPVYSEVGGDTPEPTRLNEVLTRMSEVSEANIADPTPFTMTRATMNIPEETGVSPLQTPSEEPKANGHASPIDVTL